MTLPSEDDSLLVIEDPKREHTPEAADAVSWDWVHRVINIELSHGSSEKLLEHRPDSSNKKRSPALNVMAAGADTYVSTDQPVHSGYEIKHFSLTLSERDEAIEYPRDRASEHSVHGYFLWNNIKLDWHLILSKGHINKDVSDENEHDTEYSEG